MVILAGGLATRLVDLTKERPKSMVEILDKPFLSYQLELLKFSGIHDVVLCIGHLGKQIIATFGNGSKLGMHIRYSIEEKPLGTGGALKNAESLLDSHFLVMYGDSYFFLDFPQVMSYFMSQNKLGLATVYKNRDDYDRSNIVISGNMVSKYSKIEKSKNMVYIDYGVCAFKKDVLDLIPAAQAYSLEDLFIRLIEYKQLLAFKVKKRFYEIGSPGGLKDFETYIKGQIKI